MSAALSREGRQARQVGTLNSARRWLLVAAVLVLQARSFVGITGPVSLSRIPLRAGEDELPEAPPGGRVLHVEFCMHCKYLPQYLKLRKALADRFGERVLCFANHEDTLQELCGQGTSRSGAFEVVDVKTKELLYTKLGSGVHITERQEWMDKLLEDVEKLSQEDTSELL
ncbi:unnamed protein product [Effrenium voratum]|uniref:Uncharacterized protein n=1 Tax=Effrenium voratum TaxID=2562239 RepID=A0AA36J3C9_9DINO|nr:unnamed protein product [Effrenium voratum]CAJ1430528.1 unnamed protein product [Effrenium voratum]